METLNTEQVCSVDTAVTAANVTPDLGEANQSLS